MGKEDNNSTSISDSSQQLNAAHDSVPSQKPVVAQDSVADGLCVKELKDIEKKALQELKIKIEECIKNKSFLSSSSSAPAPPAPSKSDAIVEEEKEEANCEKQENNSEGAISEEKEANCEEKVAISIPAIHEELSTVSSSTAIAASPISCDSKPDVKEDDAIEKTNTSSSTLEVEGEKKEGDPIEKDDDDEEEEEDDDSLALEDLTLWGVPLLHSKGDERTDVILLKFLRARDFKVEDAMTMLEDTLAWRKRFRADKLVEEEICSEFDRVAYMHGVDKEGHPICYNHFGAFQDKELYQKVIEDEEEFERFLRWRIQVLENGIRKLDFKPSGVNAMVQITDLNDSPGFIKRRNITRAALTLLQDNYPELVAKQIFINVPWYFGALYSLYGKIITPRSKSKVVVARPDKVTETLFKYISPENVPLRYGGFSRPNDTEFECVEAPVKEIWIKAGENRVIEIDVKTSASTVLWDIVVVGWEVVYGEEFVPNENGYTMTIRKTKKVPIEEEPVRNSFKASEAGKVVLTIDNTSRKRKLVAFRHTIKKESS